MGKIYEVYYSPTGGTKKAVKLLASQWEGEKVVLDLSEPSPDFEKFQPMPEDVCLLAVPSFGGRVPAQAAERIRRLPGNGVAAVLICVYGNRAYEDTLLELEDAAWEAGFSCAAAVAAVAEHSIMHQFAAGRPDEQDEKELKDFAEKIQSALAAGKSGERLLVHVPGSRPYKEFKGVPFKPQPGRRCTGCGLCAVRCPVGAIQMKRPYTADEELCISCMRCVKVCPSHGRNLNKLMLFAAAQKMKKACSGRKKNELFL